MQRQCLRDQNLTKSEHSVRKVTRKEVQHVACGQLGPDACNMVKTEDDEAVQARISTAVLTRHYFN